MRGGDWFLAGEDLLYSLKQSIYPFVLACCHSKKGIWDFFLVWDALLNKTVCEVLWEGKMQNASGLPVMLKDCLRTRSSWLGGFKTSLWRLQWKLNTIPAFGVYPLCSDELAPADVSSTKAQWGWCQKPKESRRQSCCLLTDPLLPFLLMGQSGTVWFQTPVNLEGNVERGNSTRFCLFQGRLWERCLPFVLAPCPSIFA